MKGMFNPRTLTRRLSFSLLSAVLAGSALLSSVQPAWAELNAFDSGTSKQVDLVIREEIKRQDLTGLAVGLVVDGKIVYLQGFGFAELKSLDKVTDQSVFRWASLSKPLTATIAEIEATAGRVNLDTPIQRYLPDYRRHEVLALKLRHLLSHQGGIGHYQDLPDWPRQVAAYLASQSYQSGYSAKAASEALNLGQELMFIPGSAFHYSTFGYLLAGGVLEAATGRGFEELARRDVSGPLKLASLSADDPNTNLKVHGYRKVENQIVPSETDEAKWKLPGGGFESNLADATRWMQALMTGPYLTAAQRQALWSEQITSGGQATGYGLGFALSGSGADRCVSHSGAQSQTRTLMAFYPERRWGVMLMSNAEWADLDKLRHQLEAVLIKRPE